MDITLNNVADTFPAGTKVDVYEKADWRTDRWPEGAPVGSAVLSDIEVAADGSVTFEGLDPDTAYYVYADLGDEDPVHTYLAFSTSTPKGNVKTHGKGFVFHDDDPDVERPRGFASVEWVGSVEPANAEDFDTWVELPSE